MGTGAVFTTGFDDVAHLVINFGGGTTGVAVVLNGQIIRQKMLPIGGSDVDQAIVDFILKNYGLHVSVTNGEAVKIRVGLAAQTGTSGARDVELAGLQEASGLPSRVQVPLVEFGPIIREYVETVARLVGTVLHNLPPELSSDILNNPVLLVGAGAKMTGLPEYLATLLELPVETVPDPHLTIIRGLERQSVE
jgi:rod shape-determining protein MreB